MLSLPQVRQDRPQLVRIKARPRGRSERPPSFCAGRPDGGPIDPMAGWARPRHVPGAARPRDDGRCVFWGRGTLSPAGVASFGAAARRRRRLARTERPRHGSALTTPRLTCASSIEKNPPPFTSSRSFAARVPWPQNPQRHGPRPAPRPRFSRRRSPARRACGAPGSACAAHRRGPPAAHPGSAAAAMSRHLRLCRSARQRARSVLFQPCFSFKAAGFLLGALLFLL